ncbi:hypothetical protein L6164_023666 [Bauhinia variegata]|uniref:Uncharacterized protein n=1 Tax=Bauhinia variegata TaxID=167791 RepID=A0ACB9MIX2_BAUVA|nr:hypothetical protein L6164_023666 [Bauhinia variegata]
MDTWGPYSQADLHGNHYYLSIIDDFTRVTWTYLLRTKSQVPATFIAFYNFISQHFHTSISSIRTDNGTEFFPLSTFLTNKGILHQKSCAYTPQQNGLVERKHQHLLTTARSLLFQASLPLHFWGDAILTATYLVNRLPTPLLHNQSPFEKLFSKPPSYSHLRVFGSLAFALNKSPHKHKFAPRSSPCVFIGYLVGIKGYKLYDIATKKIIITRDIHWFEHIFPFSSCTNDSSFFSAPAIPSDSSPLPFNTPISTFDYPPRSPLIDHGHLEPVDTTIFDHNSPLPNTHNLSPTVSSHSYPPNSASPLLSPSPPIIHPSSRPARRARLPAHLKDYYVDLPSSHANSSTQHPLSNVTSYHNLSPAHKSFSLHILHSSEPHSLKEAAQSPGNNASKLKPQLKWQAIFHGIPTPIMVTNLKSFEQLRNGTNGDLGWKGKKSEWD